MRRIAFFAAVTALFCLLNGTGLVPGAYAQQPPDDDDTESVDVRRDGTSIQTRVLREAADPDEGRPSRPGSIIVTFKSGTPELSRTLTRQSAAVRTTEPLSLPNAIRFQVAPSVTGQVLEFLRGLPWVESAEPDLIAKKIDTPNDPSLGLQWGLTKINAAAAWDVAPQGAGAKVAVLDCGILSPSSAWGDANGFPNGHPDVGPKVVLEQNFSTSTHTDDFCNHGTHVAGIVAASTDNGIGVAGIGYDASIVNVKVLGDTGSGSSTGIINGILWAANCTSGGSCGERRADVINMSLGAAGSCPSSMQSAINIAHGNGMVIVAAAGNSNTNASFWPAVCNNVVSVGASSLSNTACSTNASLTEVRASYSNYGSWVDVFAPGSCILSTDYTGGYAYFNGTSMASPFVAGLAALLESLPANLTNVQIRDRIFSTANHNLLAGSNSINGRIDAGAALASSGGSTPTPDFSVSCTPASLTVMQGQAGASTCTVTSVSDFSAAVALGCTSLLAGVTCGFAPASVTPAANATADSALTVTVGPAAAVTSDAFQVTATSGATTRQANLTLNVTAAPPVGDPKFFFSLGSSATLPGSLAVANEDIVAQHSVSGFSLYFDGSDVGLGSFTIDAFDIIAADKVLLSFTSAGTIGSLSVDDSDVVLFTGSFGPTTSGAFSMYFDGSDVGLSNDEEDVDAIQLRGGKLLISTTGAFSVTGVSGVDADVIEFTPAAGGIGDDSSAGTWAMYFDGSDVGLTSSGEDVDALAIDGAGKLYLSTTDAFVVTGVSGADEDVFVFTPTTTGATTTGSFSPTLFFDGSVHGLSANDVFAIDLP